MELTAKQQAIAAIQKANHLLLISTANPDGDSVGAALAFYLALRKMGKKATLACADPIPQTLRFLPASDKYVSDVSKGREFVIKIDISKTKAKEVRYETEGDRLKLIVVPEDGDFQASDLSVEQGKAPYDLLVVFDAADVEMIGKVYDDNTQLFFETPLLVIDHHASNEFYGEINLVEVTATSTCEVLVSLLESLDPKIIDEDIATCLMTGLVSDTGSFQNSNTTPKSLTIAAQLSATGARHQEIVKNLFRTKSYTQLCLWGRVLSRLQYDALHRLVWSTAKFSDYEELGADPRETSGLIDELMTSAPDADYVILISEREPKQIYGSIRSAKGVDSIPLAKALGGGGHPGAAGFKLSNLSIEAAEEHVLAVAREMQRERLGIKSVEPCEQAYGISRKDGRPEIEIEKESRTVSKNEFVANEKAKAQADSMTTVAEVIEGKKRACGLWGEIPREKKEQLKEDTGDKMQAAKANEKSDSLQEASKWEGGEVESEPKSDSAKSVADLLREVAEEIKREESAENG